ncbi:hypothetical protein N7462_001139 [Penicillium macrosclerotiorum]|uniref:uncharacterized protein n=1 Tax=Penicillium macrosclerotiorum TaxID=303699 RepID=UPI00254891D1|nr:uncharacterized protein N7462_001139 [Penicillium macrosclerotiorum]KAJ5699134.1 hypothetical protein N7462_001139 [Penicillium macrosclerotiorum]
MSFIFGRRRSQSDVAADHAEDDARRPTQRHLKSLTKTRDDSNESGILHGLFRRRSESGLSPDASPSAQKSVQIRNSLTQLHTKDLPRRARDQEQSEQARRLSRDCSTPSTPRSPEIAAARTSHSEPKQPGNIHDYLEYRLDQLNPPYDDPSGGNAHLSPKSSLTKKEVKALLSGAPHFMLERGKHGRWYPQVIFPWDEHNPSIQRMLDRKPLPHASFTLCTLHGHLPVPDDWAVKGGVPIPLQDWRRTGAPKRATFDVGVFEVPNMLANNGKEPGTIGFRNFLELSIADVQQYTGPEEPCQSPSMQRVSSLPATEAFELMDHYNKPYSQCLSGAVFDRCKLIRDGPSAWKRIGIRDINMLYLVQRLDQLRQLRLDVLRNGSTITVLDVETPNELHSILHTHFLYPHPPPADLMPGHPHSLKSQIKTLATVLATPGAWIDFSLPEWRFRAGQILWEVPPHADGDCLDPSSYEAGTSKQPWINSGAERKWLLIQILLAAELLFRLDAFVRVGMLHDPHAGQIPPYELQHFDKLREGKVNWDLIFVRRFLDTLDISCGKVPSTLSPLDGSPVASTGKMTIKSRRFSLFDSISRRIYSTSNSDVLGPWEYQISSQHVRQQLEGLYVFAENIGWPNIDALRTAFQRLLKEDTNLFRPIINIDGSCKPEISSGTLFKMPLARQEMYNRSRSRRCVKLRSTHPDDQDLHAMENLGWISRSWLSGLVIPGEAISHLLIGTLLENTPDAIERLGPFVNLYGGFLFRGRSYWSKASIVGRVLSGLDGAQTCMGWVGSDVLPRDAFTLQPLEPGWFEIKMQKAMRSSSGKSRIKQGGKLALESTPLGTGDITASAFTLPVDPAASSPAATLTTTAPVVRLDMLTLSVRTPSKRGITISDQASLSFSLRAGDAITLLPTTISFPLKYNVRFVSAHECRPPLGFTSHHHDCSGADEDPPQTATSSWAPYKRLPGHPLHQSFPYRYIPFESVTQCLPPQKASLTPSSLPEVLVVDARGCRAKETFVRAWCASVGYHALIGRVGRTCIACCVREANAIEVMVVVRVGEGVRA